MGRLRRRIYLRHADNGGEGRANQAKQPAIQLNLTVVAKLRSQGCSAGTRWRRRDTPAPGCSLRRARPRASLFVESTSCCMQPKATASLGTRTEPVKRTVEVRKQFCVIRRLPRGSQNSLPPGSEDCGRATYYMARIVNLAKPSDGRRRRAFNQGSEEESQLAFA